MMTLYPSQIKKIFYKNIVFDLLAWFILAVDGIFSRSSYQCGWYIILKAINGVSGIIFFGRKGLIGLLALQVTRVVAFLPIAFFLLSWIRINSSKISIPAIEIKSLNTKMHSLKFNDTITRGRLKVHSKILILQVLSSFIYQIMLTNHAAFKVMYIICTFVFLYAAISSLKTSNDSAIKAHILFLISFGFTYSLYLLGLHICLFVKHAPDVSEIFAFESYFGNLSFINTVMFFKSALDDFIGHTLNRI
jgi:hypothetical protein